MLRPLLLGACLVTALTACAAGPDAHKNKTINTALTGACLAASLSPCTIATQPAEQAQKNEAKAAATRAKAQQSASAANKDAVARSSCLTDTGPRLPVSAGQCASYGTSYSGDELKEAGSGGGNVGLALQNLDPRITVQH
jgi:hypothetical protein